MNIFYGYDKNYVDVTDIAMNQCYSNGTIYIPKHDNARANILGDPFFGNKKSIKVIIDGKETIYDENVDISLEVSDYTPKPITRKYLDLTKLSPTDKLDLIHSNIKFFGGNIKEEYPEQMMVAEFLKSDAKVLELGSNVGRNTMTIASILQDDTQLVTLECNTDTCKILDRNRQLNGFNFHIEGSALSANKLFLSGWDTYLEGNQPKESVEINTITWVDLNNKYNIVFDTIIADCEGSLYYIFNDFPNILDNIKVIIMENDFHVLEHKQFVDRVLIKNGFNIAKQQSGGWGPCSSFFYQVWTK